MNKTIGLMVVLALSAALAATARAAKSEAAPLRADQLSYRESLRRDRPDLWLRRADLCKDNLILKPRYRDQILLHKEQDFESIKKRDYSPELQALDRRWADGHRAAVDRVRAEIDDRLRRDGLDPADPKNPRVKEAKGRLPFFVKNYPKESFVGYGIGPRGISPPPDSPDSLHYKVYLEFKSAAEDLSPEAYVAFTKALSAAGYQGDSKIQLWPGVARFKFNNIVLHASTKEDAHTAERVGLAFFKDKLASTGRGLDIDLDDEDALDWNQFLCIGDVSRLSKEGLDFVRYND